MAVRDRDREPLKPVSRPHEDDDSKPSSPSSSFSHHSGQEAFYMVLRSWASKKFMTGCVILLPIAITFYITWWFISFVDGFSSPVYAQLGISLFGLGFITSVTFIFLVGVFMSSWLGASILGLGEWFIRQMPFIHHIYEASKQISAAISPGQNTEAFKEVAIIRHPRVGEYAFGFITSSVTLQVCVMMVVKLWRWYQRCLAQYPLRTQVISSGVLWGVGDVSAQAVSHLTKKSHHPDQEKEDFRINWKRVGITSMFGFAFVGPIGNYWYEGLDRFIKHRLRLTPNSALFVTAKVALDGLIFGPLDLLLFFSYMGISQGKDIDQVKEDVKRDFLPTLILEGPVWPLAQAANFRYVPVPYQLLYVNGFCLLDSAFLSWVEQQEDASWKRWINSFVSLKDKEEHGS